MKKIIHIPVGKEKTTRLLQFSDMHIFPCSADRFDGVDTAATLQRTMNSAQNREWPPDLVLATGDLVHEPAQESYQRFRSLMEALQVPVCCLPGNHDDPAQMETLLNTGYLSTAGIVIAGNWLILMLDDFLPASHGGHLSDSELEWLNTTLESCSREHVLICLHHHPVSIASPWMDRMALDNPEALFEILDRYTQVRAIVWGHIHQEYAAIRKGVRLFGTPSTCVQFAPMTDQFQIADLGPAYRSLDLLPTGEIATNVYYVTVS